MGTSPSKSNNNQPQYSKLDTYPKQFQQRACFEINHVLDYQMDVIKPQRVLITTVNGSACELFGGSDRIYVQQEITRRCENILPRICKRLPDMEEDSTFYCCSEIIGLVLAILTFGIALICFIPYFVDVDRTRERLKTQWRDLFIKSMQDFINNDLKIKYPNLIFTLIYPVCIYKTDVWATSHAGGATVHQADKVKELYCYIRISDGPIPIGDSYEPAIATPPPCQLIPLPIGETQPAPLKPKSKPKGDFAHPDILVREWFDSFTKTNAQRQTEQQPVNVTPVYEEQIPLKVKEPGADSVVIVGSDTLPKGWSQAVTADGHIYYKNNITKITQWNRPIQTESCVESESANEEMKMQHIKTNKENVVELKIVDETTAIIHEEEKEIDGNDVVEKEYPEVKDFINNKSNIMGDDAIQYYQLFVLNGYDNLEIIKTMTEQDLIDIGIVKLGHRKKMLSEVALLNNIQIK